MADSNLRDEESPGQAQVRRTSSGKLSWGLPPRPRSAHLSAVRAPVDQSPRRATQTECTNPDALAPNSAQPPASNVLDRPNHRGKQPRTPATTSKQAPVMQAPASSGHLQQAETAGATSQSPQRAGSGGQDGSVLREVLAALSWELGLQQEAYGPGLQGILSAARDAVAKAADAAKDKAQRRGRGEQERAVKEVEGRMERALADMKDKREAGERKLGEKVKALAAQLGALEKEKRAVVGRAAQQRRDSREAVERGESQGAAVQELEARLEKQARLAAKSEAAFARFRAESEAQVSSLQLQLAQAHSTAGSLQQQLHSAQEQLQQLQGGEQHDSMTEVAEALQELLDGVKAAKKHSCTSLEKLREEQADMRDAAKGALLQLQTDVASLAKEGSRHAAHCAAEVGSRLSACTMLGGMGVADVNVLVERVTQMKHQLREMHDQRSVEQELQAQRDSTWQRDVAAKEKLKAETEKLEASLALTRSTLAAVRQQNEQQNHLVASLRQDATDAMSKAKAAREEADKACKSAAARERQLQAANSTLQVLDASLKAARETIAQQSAEGRSAASKAATDTAAVIQDLLLHVRSWYFHIAPPVPLPDDPLQDSPTSPRHSPHHLTSCASSPPRSAPASRPTSALRSPKPLPPAPITSRRSSPGQIACTPEAAAPTAAPAAEQSCGTSSSSGPLSICKLSHDSLMTAFQDFLCRSQSLGLSSGQAVPPPAPLPEAPPAEDPDFTAEGAVRFVADFLLGKTSSSATAAPLDSKPSTAISAQPSLAVQRAASQASSIALLPRNPSSAAALVRHPTNMPSPTGTPPRALSTRPSAAPNLRDFLDTVIQEEEEEGVEEGEADSATAGLDFLSSLFNAPLLQPQPSTLLVPQPTTMHATLRPSPLRPLSACPAIPKEQPDGEQGAGDGGGEGWWVGVAMELVRLEGCLLTLLMELRLRDGELAEVRSRLEETSAALQLKKTQQWPKSSSSPQQPPSQPPSTPPPAPSSPVASLNAQLVRAMAAEKKALARKVRALEGSGGLPREPLVPTSRPYSARPWAMTDAPRAEHPSGGIPAARAGRPLSAQPFRPQHAASSTGGGGGRDGDCGGAAVGIMQLGAGFSPGSSSEFQEIYAVLDLLDEGEPTTPTIRGGQRSKPSHLLSQQRSPAEKPFTPAPSGRPSATPNPTQPAPAPTRGMRPLSAAPR